MSVKHIDNLPNERVGEGMPVSRQVLIGPEEGPHFAMRRFIVEPHGKMPKHTNTVEHEQFVLAGKARLYIGDTTNEVCRGNVVFIPAGVPHWYENYSSEPFEFLCIVPNLPDTMHYIK